MSVLNSRGRVGAWLASAALILCLVGAPALAGDDARSGFDFGKPKKPGTRKPGQPSGGTPEAPGLMPDDPIAKEIAQLRGWPDRKAARAAESLFLRQGEAIPYLVRALKEGPPEVQAGAAWVLGQVGEEVHVQVILGAAAKRANASRADVFFGAAYNLGAKATKRWLISFLTVANRPVFRTTAADFLVTKVTSDDRARVLNLLESDKADVRMAGLRLLDPAGVEDTQERLIQAFSDLSAAVAYQATRLLAGRADEQLIARLNTYAREAGARERGYAILALVEIARAHTSNPFEIETVKEMTGRRGLLHPERLSRGAAAVGLAYGGLDARDANVTALLDGPVVDVLIETLGGAHFRDFASVSPGVFAALRRLTGRDLPDTAVAWARWWRSNRTSFRARRPLHALDPADLPRAYVRFEAIEANGRRVMAEFVPERGVERKRAFILKQRAFEGLVEFLDEEGLFAVVERGGVRADEHVAATLGVLNQRKRMVITASRPRGSKLGEVEHRRKFERLKMRMEALVEANIWQRYRDADKWADARSWWQANVDSMTQSAPDERRALLQAAIVFSYDDMPDDLSRAEALARLQELGGRLTTAEARHLAGELGKATSFGRMEADGLRWVLEQADDVVRAEVVNVLAERREPEAGDILANLLLGGGAENLRTAFADPRSGMRSAAAHAARLLVESGAVQSMEPADRQRLNDRLRPGLEVLSLDDDPAVSIRALIALAYLGDATVVQKLEKIYATGSLNVKLEVTGALGYIPGRASHRFLTRVIAEERRDGSGGALRAAALGAMAKTNHRDAVRLLRYYLLNDKDASVRDAAGRILAEMGTVEARFAIVEQLTSGEPDAARRARLVDVLGQFRGDVVPALLRRYLGDRDERVQAAAALRAADHNMAEAFPFLVQLLRRGEGAQRDAAVTALQNLTSIRFGTKGYAAQADRYSEWYEDTRIKGKSDRDWFREALRRKGYDVGPLAGYIAGEVDASSVPLLVRVMRDDDAVLRRNANVALERISGRRFGAVERGTSARDAARVADQWARWHKQLGSAPREGGDGR